MTSITSMSGSGTAGSTLSISSLDTNGDGVVSAEELEAAKPSRTQDPTVESENAATGMASQLTSSLITMLLESRAGQAEGNHQPSEHARDLFATIDADADGTVTQEEFVTGRPADMSEEEAISLFSAADREGLGSLTEAQFVEAFEVSGPPMAAPPVADAQSGDDGSTISLLDVLDEMQRVIDAYRENADVSSEIDPA
ncbi:EF-hand domain-containing protein [Rhizobium sp. SL42]|uniref:EF-hand domain-containing protein n=1 Tax=Rhizobium sp. SL42 TaxID=2806346 RepID=UPI001EFF630C|nr:EF-hand domain-containing protein [Rhizobium sp. SL42]UJW76645.1 EF-hand domain-containing protein [Rhizobium sp. SL42]